MATYMSACVVSGTGSIRPTRPYRRSSCHRDRGHLCRWSSWTSKRAYKIRCKFIPILATFSLLFEELTIINTRGREDILQRFSLCQPECGSDSSYYPALSLRKILGTSDPHSSSSVTVVWKICTSRHPKQVHLNINDASPFLASVNLNTDMSCIRLRIDSELWYSTEQK